MHPASYDFIKSCFRNYATEIIDHLNSKASCQIVEVGSLNVNGTNRDAMKS